MDTTQMRASEPAITSRRSFDWSRWSGLIGVALLVAGVAGLPGIDPYSSTPDDYTAFYAKDQDLVLLFAFLGYLGGVIVLWMLARLRSAIDATRAPVAAHAIVSAGLLWVVSVLAMLTVGRALSAAVSDADGFVLDPHTAIVVNMITDGFFALSVFAAGALAWALTVAGRQAGLLRGWMVWVGFILVPLLPIAWALFMVPMVVFLVWLVAISLRWPRGIGAA